MTWAAPLDGNEIPLTLKPNDASFMTHSMVKRMVKTRLQSDRTSV